MSKVWKWLFGFVIILFAIATTCSIVMWQKYSKLESDYELLNVMSNTTIESLTLDNKNKQLVIDQLQFDINRLETSIDSLKKVEKRFEKKKTIFVGKTLSESVNVLKKNLCEE